MDGRAARILGSSALLVALLAGGCSSDSEDDPDEGIGDPWSEGVELTRDAQRAGDPERGRDILLNGNYMSCGFPTSQLGAFGSFVDGALGASGDAPKVSGRDERNADQPYNTNVFDTESGVEVTNQNCLHCHGGMFNGELVLGLGDPSLDFTDGLGGEMASALELSPAALAALGFDEAEQEQMAKLGRLAALSEGTRMRTVGHNPAESLTVLLVAHHDQQTLEWLDDVEPIQIRDADGDVIEDARLTSDPPPWWRVHKKNALFYNGMARGDHRGTMALATSICVDTIEEAQRIDELFVDIHAFVETVRAPAYPFEIDDDLAAQGEDIFVQTCAGCHGTYADEEADETYPNLLIPLDVIGTDPVVAEGGTVHAPELVEWYNGSFYGEVTPLEVNDPFPGYMPPPLDGIWATGPFLHNGSVPTIELLLNSEARPKYWKRTDFDTTHFDEAALGWPFEEVDYRQADAPEDERKYVYDTTYFSQSNAGHTFGDHLDDDERSAVLEYLKTL